MLISEFKDRITPILGSFFGSEIYFTSDYPMRTRVNATLRIGQRQFYVHTTFSFDEIDRLRESEFGNMVKRIAKVMFDETYKAAHRQLEKDIAEAFNIN